MLVPPVGTPANGFINYDGANNVTANASINCIDARNDVAKNSVAAIEMRLGRVSNKPLRSARVLTRKGYPYRAALVGNLVDLATDLIAGSAISITARIAILDYEVRNHAMNCDPVEVFAFGELDEVLHVHRCFVWQQIDCERAVSGCNYGRDRFAHARDRAFVIGRIIASLYLADSCGEIAGAVCFQKSYGLALGEIILRIECGLNRFVAFGALLFRKRVENRERGIVQCSISQGHRQSRF